MTDVLIDELDRPLLVTHPTTPNFSGHSRGRKCHITLDGKKSLCNMLVDSIFKPENGLNWTPVSNGLCRSCADAHQRTVAQDRGTL